MHLALVDLTFFTTALVLHNSHTAPLDCIHSFEIITVPLVSQVSTLDPKTLTTSSLSGNSCCVEEEVTSIPLCTPMCSFHQHENFCSLSLLAQLQSFEPSPL